MGQKTTANALTRAKNLFNIMNNEKELIVYDLETTGLSRKTSHIIQFSGIKYEINKGVLTEKETIDTYINPGICIPEKITEITGITDDTVKNAPTEKEAFEKIIKPFFGKAPVLSGYNISTFDTPMMESFYEKFGDEFKCKNETDIFRIAKDRCVNEGLPNNKLATIAHHYGVDTGLTFHNAFDDVRATARLLMLFYQQIEKEIAANKKTPGIVPNVWKLIYWDGYRGHSRLYMKTNYGDFYYDCYKDTYAIGNNNLYQIEEFDIDTFVENLLKKYNALNIKELVKKVKDAA